MRSKISLAVRILWINTIPAAIFLTIFFWARKEELQGLMWLMLGGILLLVLLGLWLYQGYQKSYKPIADILAQLNRGKIPDYDAQDSRGDSGTLEAHLERHLRHLNEVANFSRSLAAGDFTGRLQKLSEDDELGESLIALKNSLMSSMQEGESRRRDEANRTWSAQGLAKFASLLREAEDSFQELAIRLISELVAYTEADAGVLFIAPEEDGEELYFEAAGSYAFDRAKQLKRSFKPGEGLVGRAVLEKEMIYVNDLPSDYIRIRSGLGEDVPASLLLVPVILDKQVLGVIELASLGEIPAYQAEFIRQLSDALAATFVKVKANIRTRKLHDQTRKQAEELASQEKVYRESLEELQKARDASLAREKELLREIESLRKESS